MPIHLYICIYTDYLTSTPPSTFRISFFFLVPIPYSNLTRYSNTVGKFADVVGSTGCSSCQPGYVTNFVSAGSSADCVICPINTYSHYSSTSDYCTACPSGYVSFAGSSTKKQCFNPVSNFISGWVLSLLIFPYSFEYIILGRFQRVG